MIRWIAFFAAIALLPALALAADPIIARYPKKLGRDDPNAYQVQLLRLALEKNGAPFRLEPSAQMMNETRTRTVLARGDGSVTVAWFGTSLRFEQQFRAVYIPLERGLLGYRLFLIREQMQPVFSRITRLADLTELTALQGSGWSDVEILRGAGLGLATARYDNLFLMLSTGRGDYFPRGAAEAYAELMRERDRHPDLTVEKDLCLTYPFAMFYFVHKRDDRLYAAIDTGLRAAQADGDFDRLFRSQPHIRQTLEQAELARRRCFAVDNPLLSQATRAIPAEYWLDLNGVGPRP